MRNISHQLSSISVRSGSMKSNIQSPNISTEMAISGMTNRPAKTAQAEPLIPIADIPNPPKMNRGSSTILTMADPIISLLSTNVSPLARNW